LSEGKTGNVATFLTIKLYASIYIATVIYSEAHQMSFRRQGLITNCFVSSGQQQRAKRLRKATNIS